MDRSRFGELAVAAGYLTPERLEKAQRIRKQDASAGRVARPLGIICLQLGYMSFRQVSATLERGERKAGRLRSGFRGAAPAPGGSRETVLC